MAVRPEQPSKHTTDSGANFRFNLYVICFFSLLGILTARTGLDRVSLVAIVLLCFGLLFTDIPSLIRRRIPEPTAKRVEAIAGWIALGGLVIFLGTIFSRPGARRTVIDIVAALYRRFGPAFTLAATALLAFLGYGLFLLKTKRLLIYAYGEITFAMTSCYVAVERSKQGLGIGTLTVLGAAVYLVVRGLDNRQKALQERLATRQRAQDLTSVAH